MQQLIPFGEKRIHTSLIKTGKNYYKRSNHHLFISSLLILALLFCFDKILAADPKIFVKQITPCLYSGMWCKSINKQQKIAVLFPKKVSYLTPFLVQVRIQPEDKIQQIQLQFSMRGMQMVTNHFTLKPLKLNEQGNNKFWQTEVVLPRCISDRKDWLVELVVKTEHQVDATNFMLTIW